ncbi:hypothetical protein OAE36_00170 [bacterium]|nr:hypothetical protein [bacterium]
MSGIISHTNGFIDRLFRSYLGSAFQIKGEAASSSFELLLSITKGSHNASVWTSRGARILVAQYKEQSTSH